MRLGGRAVPADELWHLVEARTETLRSATGPVLAGADAFGLVVDLLAAPPAGRPLVVADTLPAGPLPHGAELVVTTSGTAGRPRFVARTWASWSASFPPFSELAGITAADTVAVTGSLTSTLQLFAAAHALAVGAELTDDPARATVAHGVPAVLGDLLDEPGRLLRAVVVAGAPLPAAIERRALDHGIALVEYYGATELSFVAARRAPQPFTAFPGVTLRTRGGVVAARSPYLCLGYVDGTGPFRVDRDGFATVGDRGTLSDDGALQILGRDDAITVGGATVLAADVEAALGRLPGVRGAIVVGVEQRRLGQVVGAVVATDDLTAVRRAARAGLTGAALPRRWASVVDLPRTAAGKPDPVAALGMLMPDRHYPRQP